MYPYVRYLLGCRHGRSSPKKKFVEWAKRKESGTKEDVNAGGIEWEEKNMHTAGEEFGVLINTGGQEASNSEEDPRQMSNL